MQTDDPVDVFRAYAATCDNIQKRIIQIDNKPEQTKTLRGFTLREAGLFSSVTLAGRRPEADRG